MYVVARYTVFFLVYSCLGALGETLFTFILKQKIYGVNGFLSLPILPIYGFGAILIVLILSRLRNPILLFITGALLTTALEFATHWLIETLFHVRIWDYSKIPYNLDGRVCLANSVCFGLAAVLLVRVIHPLVAAGVKRIPGWATIAAAAVIWVVVLGDFAHSVAKYLN